MRPLPFSYLIISFSLFATWLNLQILFQKVYKEPFKTYDNKMDNVFDSWHKDTTINELNIYYKIVICENEEIILLAIENGSNSNVFFSWTDEVWVDCLKVTNDSNKTFFLKFLERQEGLCQDNNLKLLQIKLSDIKATGNHITKYHFGNISVIK